MEMNWLEGPPPNGNRRQSAYPEAMLDELKKRPGQWAGLWTYNTRSASGNAAAKLRKEGFEAVSRGLDLFACWPGDPDADS